MDLQNIFILLLLAKMVVLKPTTEPVQAAIKHVITDKMRENARATILNTFLLYVTPNKTYRISDQLIEKFTLCSECAEMIIYNNITARNNYNNSIIQNASELDLLFNKSDLDWAYSKLVSTAVINVRQYMIDSFKKALAEIRKRTQKLESDKKKLIN